jgi:hypothetical protein
MKAFILLAFFYGLDTLPREPFSRDTSAMKCARAVLNGNWCRTDAEKLRDYGFKRLREMETEK